MDHNGLRKIAANDLTSFNTLQFLKIKDNLIVDVEEHAFSTMRKLRMLDLSNNTIKHIPSEVFMLPSLEKLSISYNTQVNLTNSLRQLKYVTSPLKEIDVSFTTNKNIPQEFPNFGEIPYLQHLNISGNYYVTIRPTHIAGLCNLEFFGTTNLTVVSYDGCDCWMLNDWLEMRNVLYEPLKCEFPSSCK